MRNLVFGLAAALVLVVGCNKNEIPGDDKNSLTVVCHNGKMVGYSEGNIAIFKGIPFAVPPTGELRWKDPVEAPESDEEIICKKFGHVALQAEDKTGSEPAASSKDKDEDCLTLNIWTQNFNPSSKKAVMFYIHGGAFALGGTIDPMYDGRYLAAEDPDIIVVTTNYRVGIMGFLSLDNVPGYTEEYKNAGKLGILDQQMALKWVKRNIAKFGGDPDNVTIFGESAGGGSVACHLVMPSSKGLFKRAIMMSGDGSLTTPRIATVGDEGTALNGAKRLMEATGKSDLAGLLSLEQGQILKALDYPTSYGGILGGGTVGSLSSYPVFDNDPDAVLPNPYEALKNGAGAGIELMVGTLSEEMNYFTYLDQYMPVNNILYKDKYKEPQFGYWDAFCDYSIENHGTTGQGVKEAFKEYLEKCPSERDEAFYYEPDPMLWRKTDLLSELFFRQGAICTADLHSKNGNKTYMYYFKVPHFMYSACQNSPWVGSCHSSDVVYAFNNWEHKYCDKTLSSLCFAWSSAFIRFAKTGDPGWAPYDSESRNTMIVDRRGEMQVVSNPLKERNDILNPVFLNYFNSRTSTTMPDFCAN